MRSPLAERTAPKSPLLFNGNGSFTTSNALPPLKFHSGLLAVPHSLVAPSLEDDEDEEVGDDESTASVSDSTYSYEEALGSSDSKPIEQCYDDEEELFGCKPSANFKRSTAVSSLNRGFLNESLRVEVPDNLRRFTDGELGFRKTSSAVLKSSTPCGGGNHLQKRIHLRNLHVRVVVIRLC